MTGLSAIGPAVGLGFHFAAAVGCGLSAAWIGRGGRTDLPARRSIVAALLSIAAWCVAIAASEGWSIWALATEAVRNLALLNLCYRLCDTQGQRLSMRPVLMVLAVVQGLQIGAVGLGLYIAGTPVPVMRLPLVLSILVAIGALLMVHNLSAGVGKEDRGGLRPTIGGLLGLWAFELNYYAVTALTQQLPTELGLLRGLVVGACGLALIFGSRSDREPLTLRPSRTAALQTLSLVAVTAYLLIMVAISELLALLDGNAARLAQLGLITAGAIFALLWLPSARWQSWLKVVALKHFFRHRYDYRSDWQRLMESVSDTVGDAGPLSYRFAKAVADITESPAARLYLIDEDGRLSVAAEKRSNAARFDDDSEQPLTHALATMIENDGAIVDLDAVRSGKLRPGEEGVLPAWMVDDPSCWALVPLMHFDRLVGLVLLGRPTEERTLDWEDFDLLKLAGRQVASYLAEQAGHEALAEAGQFDQFNRRIAFVMHDIKNLASQLNLLARNAERHADKPEFRADMLVTLRTSSDKLQTLLDRLGGYGPGGDEALQEVALGPIAALLERRFSVQCPIDVTAIDNCRVMARRDDLVQALVHLVQNAIDASPANSPVQIVTQCDGLRGRIEIIDVGEGMDSEFLRQGLFRPFVSSRNGGFGIGAFEARELIRAMDGRLDVTSRKGVGTRFVISLPLAGAAGLLADTGNATTQLNKVA